MSQLKPTHISSFSYWAEENIRIVIAHYMCSAARYAYKLLSPGPHHRKTDNAILNLVSLHLDNAEYHHRV